MVWVDKGALAVLSDAAVAAMVEGATATRGRVDERATAAANSAVAVSEAGEPARIASQLSSPTPARSAVDARIGSVVNSVVGDALASTPGVVDSVIDSINDNPTVLGALAHYKGQLLGGSIEDLVTGEYWVANQTAANALGLPDPWGGPLDVVRNGTSGSVVWRPTIDGAPRVWRKRRTSTGWGQWWADQPKPIRLTDANTTTLDALPDGTYYQDLLVVQEKLGLPARTGWILKQTHPTVGYGYCSMVEWTRTAHTQVGSSTSK